jgi:hypothetical protein
MRAVERWMLKIRGVDPDELQRELREMDAAKRRRDRKLEEARAHAREKHGDDVAFDMMRRRS